MNHIHNIAAASLVAGLFVSAPAFADYDIVDDPAFPSVTFIEFDASTLPVVYTAPQNGSLTVIGGGDAGTVRGDASSSSTNSDRGGSSGSELSLDQRAEQRVRELVNSDADEIENLVIDREIEDRLIEDIDKF